LPLAVGFTRFLRFFRKIKHGLCVGLHSECHLQRLDPRFQSIVLTTSSFKVQFVHLLQKIELSALTATREIRVADVLNDLLWINTPPVVDMRALKNAWQETVTPQLRSHDRLSRAQHDIARKVLILSSQTIQQPRTHRRPCWLSLAAIHHEQRWFVVGNIGVH
jgi:hypothetical protein